MTRSRSHSRLRRAAVGLAAPLLMACALAGAGPAPASAANCQNWTGVQPPSPGVGGNELRGVAVLSACGAWAVGDDVGSNGGRQTLIEHWNGAAWTVVPSPDPGSPDNSLTSVGAVSSSDVWAVGYTASGAGDQTLILRWDGTAWKQVPSPDPGTFSRLYSVRAVSASDAWAVGFFSSGAGDQTLILHWDGTAWKQVPSPDPGGTGSDNDLFSVAATSHSDAWAVGEAVTSSKITTLTAHWNGRRWASVASPNPGRSTELFSVADTSGSNAWAVGDATNGAADQTLVLHWNGTRWAQVTSPDQGGTTNGNVLAAVTATAASNAWAVGYFRTTDPSQALALHCC